ncbi:hypothetical protein IRP63_00880 [Clostridium botulinum]|uniref:Uncharacterized protein n=1 Tax=Clostridium botulinum C/D str. DC5 TaxID=1443128 RepID=A0A0A0IDK6_CLOBO|nr:hypothetical protein [Clostridium botulinum]KEI06823.1 hypothetical protein Z952_03385 [Clostridium botulinum C/D str. BKT75002]KEI10933.1 hypothetical protein Z954_09990 [Clostridium botulinum C/D str. BKT2873]KGM94791.1 hypothetical protein Z956_06445 [Clostridium botulinum D str. CCUG 7971]KGM98593.1 hypothetical protein Z955_11000 [Clostridium botulinum C/D str. DC5]KOC56775.1 hypothetical protein ADU89_02055 [Clostridium botulinum]
MYNDRASGEQIAIAAALVGVLISRSLTLPEIGIFGNFLEVVGDVLLTIQSQATYTRNTRIKYKKDVEEFIRSQVEKDQREFEKNQSSTSKSSKSSS